MINTDCIYRINFPITLRKGAQYGFVVPNSYQKNQSKNNLMPRDLCHFKEKGNEPFFWTT